MVGPAAKRDAVAHLRGVLEMSERRACSLVAADRKMIRNRHGGRQRPSCVPGCTSLPINGAASAIVASTSCCGTKASDPASISSTGSIARRDWLCANAEDRRKALGTRARILVEAKPNARWSLDFVHDQLACGRRFRILNIVDDATRECLAAIGPTGDPRAHGARRGPRQAADDRV